MHRFQPAVLATFFSRIEARGPGLLPACRWLLMGPALADWVCPTDGMEPTLPEMIELLRLLDDEEPEVETVGRALLTSSPHLGEAKIEHGLDRLLHADEGRWTHPGVVLGRPCAEFTDLLARCSGRLQAAAGEDRRRLESVRGKLRDAVALERTARHRASRA
ncbi:MAG: hypothetical protein GY719_21925 [bacterium]|nr:hypothetical protein [bacterium]